MTYAKPWKSFDDQLATLHGRGLDIGDRDDARRHLECIGYYRLSGYWHAFPDLAHAGLGLPVNQSVLVETFMNISKYSQLASSESMAGAASHRLAASAKSSVKAPRRGHDR